MSDYYLPPSVEKLLNDGRMDRCQNLGLMLDKYPIQVAVQKSEEKSEWLQIIKPNTRNDPKLAEHAYLRWFNAIKAVGAQYFSAKTDWRMVVGLGGESVLETDLTLHHLYGIPFIPGSALKGLTRAYVTGEIEEHRSAKIEDDSPLIQHIFGTQKEAGCVIFFDAMPVDGKVEIDLDIMNAHYPDYYGKGEIPANNQNPNPVTFLTVTKTTFMFALAPRRPKDAENINLAMGWLQSALKEYGVGGKTSAGYGYFVVLKQETQSTSPTSDAQAIQPAPPPPSNPDLKKAEGYKREIDAMRDSNVANQINSYHQKWQQLTSQEARLLLATVIVEKVRKAGREKASAEKAWYKELLAFLADTKEGQ